MANEFYNRGATFNPDELADGDALEAEFDAVVRGFDTINTAIDTGRAGYPTQTFHVAPATEATHAPQKAQLDAHIDAVVRGFDTINTAIDTGRAGYPTQTFHVAPATKATHAPQKAQLDAHINDQGGVHGATSAAKPDKIAKRDSNGDISANSFIGKLTGNSDTATKTEATAPTNGVADLVSGAMSGSDNFRIRIGGAVNAGWVEIATADDGAEPIYVRQYSDVFTTVARTLELLDSSGNTKIPGLLFVGGYRIIEAGSNANGIYIKFADGTLICLFTVKTLAIAYNTNVFFDFNPPSAFVGVIYPLASTHEVWNGGVNGKLQIKDVGVSPGNTTIRAVVNSVYNETINVSVAMAAVGRWL